MSCVNILDNDSTLVTPPTFGGDHQPCAENTVACCNNAFHSASAQQTIVFLEDGTWQVYNAGATTGVIDSGLWYEGPPTVVDPQAYEIRFVGQKRYEYDTRPPVAPYGDCPDPQDPVGYDPPYDTGWLPLSSQQQQVASFNLNNGQVCILDVMAINEFTVEIRRIGSPADSVTASVSLCAHLIQASG